MLSTEISVFSTGHSVQNTEQSVLSVECQVSATELSAAGAKCEALGPATRDVFLPGIFFHHIEMIELSRLTVLVI